MRVAALWLAGDHEGARRHAVEFARRHPDSLFLPSVQRAVTERRAEPNRGMRVLPPPSARRRCRCAAARRAAHVGQPTPLGRPAAASASARTTRSTSSS